MTSLEIYHYLWFFLMYAFMGWCCEVIYAIAVTGEFVNRGFLNGPFCPIYGFGAVGVVSALTPLADNLVLLFLGSVVLTSVLEWVSGYILEKVFRSKWWDYADKPFNIGGYVCLSFSLMWGIGCVFVVKLVHPAAYHMVDYIPVLIGWVILGSAYLLLSVDVVMTVISVVGLNKLLDQLEGIAQRINKLSVELGEKRPEVESLLLKQKELITNKSINYRRIIRAFPKLKSVKFAVGLEKLKTELISSIKKGL